MRTRYVSDDAAVEQRVVQHATWSPAQIVALVVGIVFLVLGGVSLARTGFTFSPQDTTDVAGFGHTTVLGLIEIGFGVLTLAVGAIPGADRGGMIFCGALALVAGLIVAIEPDTFADTFGVDVDNGILYIVAGALLLVAAMISPMIGSTRVERDGIEGPPL